MLRSIIILTLLEIVQFDILIFHPDASVTDKLKSPTGSGMKGQTGNLLTSVIDAEYIPLAVDVCNWVAEQTNSCIEIEQFIPVSARVDQ